MLPLHRFGVGIAGLPHEPNLLLGTNVEGGCPPFTLVWCVDRPPMAVSWPIEADAVVVGCDDCLFVGESIAHCVCPFQRTVVVVCVSHECIIPYTPLVVKPNCLVSR